jgi:HAE1 family hydrophobic/amphiphilic exporter-1
VTPRHYEEEGKLPRFSLDRRITVLVLFLTLLVVGAVAALRIPVELFPSGYDDPFLWVGVPWENAPAREVLDKVSLPLEEELSTVRGIDNLFTVSTVGAARAFMQFKHGTDMDVAYREVRDRIERARSRFPEDIDRVHIMKDDQSGIPVKMLGVAVDPEIRDAYDLIQNALVQRMSRVDGVASVEVHGVLEKEILIELDREKTSAAGLNIWDLAQGLGGDNFTMASGTVREGSRKLLLRSVARFSNLEELENRIVGANTRLRDVATVSYQEPKRDFRVRAMSRPAVAIEVLKEGEANVKKVSAAFDAEMERIERDPRFAGLWMATLFDQGKIIDESLDTLLNSGMIGGTIAVIVLLFFLRRIRLTIIIALAIPLSILIGLTVMYFAGESLNILTLLGLMICIGLLVDNSVVVAENIHRLHRERLERRQACVHGAGEVGLAITMSTLTTIVVFAPVAIVDGPGQFFLLRLALPVCVSVAGSLLVALVFIPLCVYLTLPTRNGNGGPGLFRWAHDRGVAGLRVGYEATFGRLNRAYNGMLAFFLQRRLDLILVVLLVFAITVAIPIQNVDFVEVQEEERAGFGIHVELPPTNTLEETEEWFLQAEKIVESKKDELDLDGWWHVHEATDGRLHGWFNSPRTNEVSPTEATRIVKEALPKQPGVRLRIRGEEEGRDDGRNKTVHTINIQGEDPDLLDEVKRDLEAFFARVEGVVGVRGGNEPPPNELGIVVDRERAQRYGVNPQHVAGVVSTALMGMQLPKYRDGAKEVPVRIRYQEQDRESLTELADFRVPTSQGEMLPLSALTETQFLPTPQTIVRRNKRMGRVVTLELGEENEQETRRRLAALQAGIDLPEGVSFGADAQELSFNEDMSSLWFALAISIVLIYLLMGFLFESFILPLSIILTIPLSIIGVYWTHFVLGKDIDFLGMVAIVLLVGVVVNNGIVLIDYVNRLRHQGQARLEAVLAATNRRFRPIMMTAITTIGGLIPLALAGSSSIGLSYKSFAMTLIGGMTTATLLTLLVVPVFYTLFDDAREACSAALRRALGRVAPARAHGGLTPGAR